MAELTVEQQRAKARARARLRLEAERAESEPRPDTRNAVGRAIDSATEGANEFIRDTPGLKQAANASRDVLTGLANFIPGARDAIANTTGAVRNSDVGPDGLASAGFEGAGQALAVGGASVPLLAAAAPRAVAAGAQGVGANAARMSQGIVNFARNRPGVAAGTEALAGFGAAVGGDLAEQGGDAQGVPDEYQPAVRMGGEVLGGVGAAVAPGAATSGLRIGGNAVLKNALPFTTAGGRPRAEKAIRGRAENAEQAARRGANAPEGVTPARASGDQRLMAQERRVLDDNPELDRQVREELAGAQTRLEGEFQAEFGEAIKPLEKARQLIEFTAAPGTKIEPGATDEMMDAAYESFKTAYAGARGHVVDASRLGGKLGAALEDPNLLAGEGQRAQVRNMLNNQIANMQRNRVRSDGLLTSDELIELRSVVRDRQRGLGNNVSGEDRQTLDVLRNVEKEISKTLDAELPPAARDALRATDQQYRKFKVAEDAVFKSGNKELTPERLSESIRTGARSRGEFARGGDQEFRNAAMSRQSTEQVLGDPDAAKRMARGLSGDELKPLKADFASTLQRRALGTNEDGTTFLDGGKLKVQLNQNRDVAKNLGLTDEELSRFDRIADELVTVQRPDAEAVNDLVVDGPAFALRAISSLIGARSGGQLAQNTGGGTASSLVLAQMFSSELRKKLARVTSSKANKLLTDAVTDKELFSSLLTRNNASLPRIRQAEQRLNAWFLANAPENVEAAGEDARPAQVPDDVPPFPDAPAPQGLLDDPAPRPAGGLLQ